MSSERLAVSGSDILRIPTPVDLRRRDAQRELVLRETDYKQLKLKPGDFLLLDRDDLTDPVSGIDDELVELEALTLARALQRLRRRGGFFRDDRLLNLDHGRGGLCRRRRLG